MTTPSIEAVAAELQQLVGMESAAASYLVEKGHIRRFAEAIGDPNPLFSDGAAARKGPYGGIIAPPTFLRNCSPGPFSQPIRVPLARNLDGGSDWEYLEPIRPGDTITAVQRFAAVTTRQSRLGTMIIMSRETRYTNQFGKLVAIQRSHGMSY
ncbi:MAG: MaoC family dehydratase [SAR202 cluster bacterium]|nr:MaoC family dehydratase [SAR202 cluster bacterium]